MHPAFALPLLNHFANLSRLGSSALIAAIWQGALLAVIAALGLRLMPRISAAARFAIWFAVFTLIAALPILQSMPRNLSSSAAPSHAFFSLDSRWTLAIAALWAAASLLRAATLLAAAHRVHSLARNATPIVHQLTSTPRRAQLCSSTDVDRPTVIGFFAPKILIPTWLLEKLTPAELEHVVLHESGHLNRADDWLNLLQKFALVVFPLNPALAWVERRLCFERELACDERVLAELRARAEESEHSATSYASSLATLAEYRLQHRGMFRAAAQNLALALGALGRESELGRRVARILRPAARMKPLHVRLATGTAIVALLFTTTELERTPQLVSFNAPAPASAQLATATAQSNTLLPGYRAVATRLTLPAAARSNSIGDAAPHLRATHASDVAHSAPDTAQAHAIPVAVPRTPRPAARMISFRQPASQPSLVVTRYTVTEYQSADGYRIVRTSAVFAAPAPQTMARSDADPTPRSIDAPPARTPHAQQISQPDSPYAAVPVPGGWLVFQL